nr:hypothetical protein L203_05996 [Cryptococcus depauperatus CBS 7841]
MREWDEMYPPDSPRRPKSNRSFLTCDEKEVGKEVVDLDREREEWKRVQKAIQSFLSIGGKQRMWDAESSGQSNFESTTFIPAEFKYLLRSAGILYHVLPNPSFLSPSVSPSYPQHSLHPPPAALSQYLLARVRTRRNI